nr:hypothetical protein Itr_chr12CG00500 [Ipomoea trifida]
MHKLNQQSLHTLLETYELQIAITQFSRAKYMRNRKTHFSRFTGPFKRSSSKTLNRPDKQ